MTTYFLTPDYTFPSGGVRVIYRHVDILNAHGIEAYVLHRKAGHRANWFQNETPIVYWDNSLKRRAVRKIERYLSPSRPKEIPLRGGAAGKIGSNDVLVVPEIYGPGLAGLAPGVPKVILNQNCYLMFRGYKVETIEGESPYRHPDVKGVLINSEDGLEYLNYVFPEIPVHRFRLSIDSVLFRYEANKKPQICFTPRKNKGLVVQVINILRERNALDGFDLVPFEGMPQSKVADIMRESAFFLSFGQSEGFGLPPAEAMASGCVVIGYHAGGGKEFFRPEFSIPIPYGEVIEYAEAIERALREYRADPEPYRQMGRDAAAFIDDTYSAPNEEADVLEFWKGVMGR